MSIFNKNKEYDKEKYTEVVDLIDKQQLIFDSAPVGTKEKGDALLKWINLYELKLKIKPSRQDSLSLNGVKKMYKLGLKLKKWKK